MNKLLCACVLAAVLLGLLNAGSPRVACACLRLLRAVCARIQPGDLDHALRSVWPLAVVARWEEVGTPAHAGSADAASPSRPSSLGIPAGAVEEGPPVLTDEGTLANFREVNAHGAGSPGGTEGFRLRMFGRASNPATPVTVEEYVEH